MLPPPPFQGHACPLPTPNPPQCLLPDSLLPPTLCTLWSNAMWLLAVLCRVLLISLSCSKISPLFRLCYVPASPFLFSSASHLLTSLHFYSALEMLKKINKFLLHDFSGPRYHLLCKYLIVTTLDGLPLLPWNYCCVISICSFGSQG